MVHSQCRDIFKITVIRFIARRDHRVMRRANQWPAPPWVQKWALASTRAGDGWIWLLIGLALLLFGGAERLEAVLAGGFACGASVLAFMGLKRVAGRRRPYHVEPHCWATLLPPDQFSFPSGHTMTGFAAATALSLFYPSLAIGLYLCAVSIAISRILLGMHYLSDVVAGALIGAALGYASFALFR
jgi:undecaprenyl-diphosphatase